MEADPHSVRINGSNVPGVALYFQILQGIRSTMRTIPFFLAHDSNQRRQLSTLPRLSPHGDLFAGAVARIAVGLVLNPVTLVKARFEVKFASTTAFF